MENVMRKTKQYQFCKFHYQLLVLMHIESTYGDPFMKSGNQTHVLFSMNDPQSQRHRQQDRDPSGVDQELAESFGRTSMREPCLEWMMAQR
jgi:hypothetical protein